MQHPNHPGLVKHTALLTGIVAGIALTFSERAAADDDWYIRAAGGISWIDDDDSADLTDPAGTQNADASFDPGYTVSLAVGRWFNRNWRADLEWAYRSNDNDEVVLDDGRIADDGNFASSSLSVNAYYHFTDGREIGRISPYLGAGLAWVNEIDIDLEGLGGEYEDLEDDGFGVQVMAGLSYRQSQRLRWDAEVRWLYFDEADLDNAGVKLESVDYNPLTVTLGFSYSF
jgi:outer membrane protein W